MDNPNLRAILFFPRRIVWLVLTFLVMTAIIFSFQSGASSLEANKSIPPDQAEALKEKYNLDQPVWRQYIEYLSDVLRGDFGPSFVTKQPVAEMIDERLPSTLRLLGLATLAGMVLSVLIILPGVLVLWVRDKVSIPGAFLNRLGQIGVTLAAAIPAFLLGLLLLYIFSLRLRWLPVAGWADVGSGDNFNLRHAILPTLTLAALPAYLVARSVLGEIAHYRVAVEKRGLLSLHLLLRFFRDGLIQLIGMLGGALLVEAVFSLPGVGRLFLQSILSRDYPMIVGLVSSFLVWALIIRALADLVQGVDGFVQPKLHTTEAKAETPGETPTYAKVLSVIWIVFCVLLIVIPLLQGVGGLLTPEDSLYKQNLRDNLLPLGSEGADDSVYAWGTDRLGRDVRSRARYALGVDLVSSLGITAAVLIPALLGGLLAGYLAKQKKIWADVGEDVVMFPVEILTSVPGLALLAFILSIGRPGLPNLLIWLTLVFLLPRSVRMMRHWWIAALPEKAIWSRLGGIVLGVLVLGTGLAAVTQPAMGFLGLGAAPPQPDIGFMLAEGMKTMSNAPHIVLRTGQALFFAAFGWFLLADTILSKFGIHQREGWLELNR
jgi:ABC-type dipeptide/oligopeptide/nickel transport system permease component